MSESERRRKYRYDRVLIETARVLDPQFDDSVVYLTGAQIEMLRNMTQYLNRLDTYVAVYNLGYYLAPTVEEYDSILAIVADMEEALMGNPNTIWGYGEELLEGYTTPASGDGDKDLFVSDAVPAGEVWRVEGIVARNEDTACSKIVMHYQSALGTAVVHEQDAVGIDELVEWHGVLTLAEEGQPIVTFYDCLNGDTLYAKLYGYKMLVPE